MRLFRRTYALRIFERFAPASDQTNRRTFVRQGLCQGPADATTGACYECGLTCELIQISFSLRQPGTARVPQLRFQQWYQYPNRFHAADTPACQPAARSAMEFR